MKNFKKLTYDILILVFPVMLGVYLGLLANDWNETKKENQLIQKVLSNLVQEVEHNQEVIKNSIPYFIELRDSIYLKDKTSGFNPSQFSFWKGLNPPLLKSSSFESALITGTLSNLDLALLEQLTTTYKIQEDLKQMSDTYIASITNKIGTEEFNNSRYLIILENYAHDHLDTEEALFEELKKSKSLLILSIKN